MTMRFLNTFNYKLIYIFRINDNVHNGLLKIGDATIHTNTAPELLINSCRELNQAAKQRINSYTTTAGITYELLHTELALVNSDGFRDYNVHNVLKHSGIKQHFFNTTRKQNEWYKVDLQTAQHAIKAVKEGRSSLNNSETTKDISPVIFRPEQKDAIERTISQYKKSNRMLWNAKMRFGKTLSALEVVKQKEFKRTIILTHRPVVSKGWFEDFYKIFNYTDNYTHDYKFGSRNGDQGSSLKDLIRSNVNYVYFASMQDLRGSGHAGGKFDKNDEVFNNEWDFIIIDEAHEGTQTELGNNVLKGLTKSKNAKVLHLSGTPFNIMSDFDDKEIYTWDYVMEQSAKADWATSHFGDTNPYDGLPRLNIFTYNLNKIITNYEDFEDKAFNFREFFRTWTGNIKSDRQHLPKNVSIGDFVHKDDVNSFLNLITKSDGDSNYPFSTEEYRNFFRHSLWMVPGVKEAKALSSLLKQHPIFGSGAFNIANVAGEGDTEENTKDALKKVEDAIGENPDDNYSITISCGRLTTGVSIKAWTTVLMLSGSYSTKASTYMQTIFRVQTPATINGKVKEQCYVFDFAPDRTLKIIAETSKISAKAGTTSDDDRDVIGDFLNFCPVISIDGTKMQPYDVDGMLQQLKRVYTDKVVSNGFDDIHIYNDKLLQLDNLELAEFKDLRKIIGASKQTKKVTEVDINNQGLTNEEYERLKKANKKPKKELTDEDKKVIEKAKEKQEQKQSAISTLRGISIRIPLMIYGADIPFDEEITIENFTSLIDSLSWNEFMPTGVTKQKFNYFAKYFDPDIFVAAGRKIRIQARSADTLSPTERVKRITKLFSTFKNPDKETVLTPWRVVNMHLGDCLGGYDFYDEEHKELLTEPRFLDHGEVTTDTLANTDARILELNSKTGLYPLFVVYSIFRQRCKGFGENILDWNTEQALWFKTVAENIFVICKTPMAKQITKRTLIGYNTSQVNTRHFDDLINQITNKTDNFLRKVVDGKNYWKTNNETDMKFNAVVGNPPYQVMDGGGTGSSAVPTYDKFVSVATKIKTDYISMIIPAKWYSGGRGLNSFRNFMLNSGKISLLVDFSDSRECFDAVDIAGGVCYFLWDENNNGLCKTINIKANSHSSVKRALNEYDVYIRDSISINIIEKAKSFNEIAMSEIVYSSKPFGFRSYFIGEDKPFHNSIALFGSKGISYVRRDTVAINSNLIDKWKVVLSKTGSEHAGQADKQGKKRVLSRIEVLKPKFICSETYLLMSTFNIEQDAINLKYYLHTKFFRFLVSTILLTQNIAKDKFQFVPIQDFTPTSDIDWSKSIPEIDQQLYAKYKLSEEEIAFIESMIKPMF